MPAASTRLARGALFAFAVSAAACGGSTESDPKTVTGDTGAAKADTGTVTDSLVDDTGGPVAAYGGPPDTGKADTGTTKDSSTADTLDGGGPAPAYGLPPFDGG